MKNHSKLIAMAFLLLSAVACEKQETPIEHSDLKSEAKVQTTSQIMGLPTGDIAHVYPNPNGGFSVAWAGGINFSTFTYPNSISPSQDGTLWGPYFDGVTGDSNMLYYSNDGSNITFALGTYLGGITTNTRDALSAYTDDYNKYMEGDTIMASPPSFSTYATRFGGSDDGIILIHGKFILDSSSPTNVSITESDFIPNPTPEAPDESIHYLGVVQDSNGINYYCKGRLTSNVITNVYKVVNNIEVPFYDFEGVYLVLANGLWRSLNLTIFPGTASEEFIMQNAPIN